ncbi:hypothetical protein B0T18DRAFT_147959 [Schizothecium vesticola]|uniref:Uncharacterized protein n=1 Tax=Schizothecium vesticola TaxID=314040 RepID=A0AA40EVG2_9PEZI|nr:hypothetical protein B0T18DRAFT_147959 [Schizothecium vesticola]
MYPVPSPFSRCTKHGWNLMAAIQYLGNHLSLLSPHPSAGKGPPPSLRLGRKLQGPTTTSAVPTAALGVGLEWTLPFRPSIGPMLVALCPLGRQPPGIAQTLPDPGLAGPREGLRTSIPYRCAD